MADVVKGIMGAVRYKDNIVGTFKSALGWMKDNWRLLLTIITSPIAAAAWFINRYKDKIIGTFKATLDWIRTIWATVQNWITSPIRTAWNFIKGINLFDAGKAFLESFWHGILSVKDKVVDGVKGIMGEVRDFLPFSDAKVGPLSQLTEAGKALIETFQNGYPASGELSTLLQCKISCQGRTDYSNHLG